MATKKEKFEFKTRTGHVKIERTDTEVIMRETRTCFGFSEECTTKITKLDDDCIHYLFSDKQSIIETLKNN